MPDDVVAIRGPRFIPVFLLAFLCFQLTGAVLNVVEEDSPLAVFDPPWVFAVPLFTFGLALTIANDRLAGRFSTGGLQVRGVRVFRYDVAVRWDQIERIWVDRQGGSMVLVRLRDPDAVAGADSRLRRSMRRRRARPPQPRPLTAAGRARDAAFRMDAR